MELTKRFHRYHYNLYSIWTSPGILRRLEMFKRMIFAAAATALMVGLGATGALADDCSGRDHTTGTVVGAAGGGIIGGLASHGNGLGIIGGALLGGLAGNAISRDMDCDDQRAAAPSYAASFRG